MIQVNSAEHLICKISFTLHTPLQKKLSFMEQKNFTQCHWKLSIALSELKKSLATCYISSFS